MEPIFSWYLGEILLLYQKFQHEFLIICFLRWWFDKIIVFDVYRSWIGQVGSWDLGRKEMFGAQRFLFFIMLLGKNMRRLDSAELQMRRLVL